MVSLGNSWDELLGEEFEKPYYQKLREFLKSEYAQFEIYPKMEDIFNALRFAAYEEIKAVIIGQDPYHEPNQAHGLSFSVKKGVPPPPSLVNIFKEQKSDLGIIQPHHGELTEWARQGVLLLNATLTVRRGQANSHRGKGWELFTDAVIEKLSEREKPAVFMLWGANARAKAPLIKSKSHLVLSAVHPSPLSAYNGFFGCRHFSAANDFLLQNGEKPIDWQLHE